MAAKTPKNLLGIPKRKSGQDMGYQKNQNMVQEHQFSGQNPTVTRVKTDGRIGSVTPPNFLKGGFTADNNSKVQPHSGGLGAVAASHLGLNPKGGTYSPRVAKARATAAAGRKAMSRPHTNPINAEVPSRLKHVKPD
jgi:hypothetical protein